MDSSYCIDELNDHTKNLVKFVLNNVSSKLPIKQSDIIDVCDNRNKKMFARTLRNAKSYLAEYHGLDLIEVLDVKTKYYIVVSTTNAGSEIEYNNKQRGEVTLLFLILSYIFMKGHPITDDNLVQYLSKFKIFIDDSHPFFGEDIRKMISQTFVKQLYLKREKDNSINAAVEDNYLYSWGFRSTIEFPKDKVLETVAGILRKPLVCFIRQQLEISGLKQNEEADVEMN